MFGLPLGIVIETLVTILLATTIGYCVILNQRLKRLHADRGELKQMVADLMQATGLANAATQELKHTAQEAETVLESRLGEAERFGVELANHVSAGHGDLPAGAGQALRHGDAGGARRAPPQGARRPGRACHLRRHPRRHPPSRRP